jgi:hypothetical protein
VPGFNYSDLEAGANRINFFPAGAYALTTAVTGVTPGTGAATGVTSGVKGAKYATLYTTFGGTVTGGTSATIYLQTSLDGGTTWTDIHAQAYANTATNKITATNIYIAPGSQGVTGTDGSLAAGVLQGVLGDRFRLKITSVGTYAAATIAAVLIVKG